MVIGKLTAQSLYNSDKVFLNTDKSNYYPGDTVWINARVFDATTNQISKNAGILHLILKNPQQKNIKYLKSKISDGKVSVFMPLIKNQSIGNYQLIAYTELMKADGEAYYSKKNIKIIPRVPVLEKKVISKSDKPLIEFFPEGGQIVANLDCKVGFRFNKIDSLGKGFEGIIKDSKGKEVAYFYNSYKGLGSFLFKPEFDTQYKAVFTYGRRKMEVPLQTVQQEGYVMSADNVVFNGGILVNIHSNKNEPEKLRLIAHQRGEKLLDVPFETINSIYKFVVGDYGISADGIVELLLLNSQSQVICERLVYFQKNKKHKIKFSGIKKSLLPKGKVEFDLNLNDELGNPVSDALLNVSISDAFHSKDIKDEYSNFHTYLLLNSDLSTPLVGIDTLFDMPTTVSRQNFDLFMLNQKGRKTILEDRPQLKAGQDLNYSVKVLVGDTIFKQSYSHLYFLDKASYSYQKITTDSIGSAQLSGIWVDSVKVLAFDENMKPLKVLVTDDEKIDLVSETPVRKPLPATPTNVKPGTTGTVVKTPATPSKPAAKNVELKEVVVVGKQNRDLKNDYRRRSYNWEADQEIILDKVTDSESSEIKDFLQKNINDFDFNNFQLMIDGKFVSHQYAKLFRTDAVAQIDVLTKQDKIKKISVSGLPVVHLLTKKDKNLESIFKNVPAGFYGYTWEKPYFSPDYTKKANTVKPDRRTSLFFKSGLKTDKTGKCHVAFFNSDTSRSYYVTISGMDAKGIPVYYSGLLK